MPKILWEFINYFDEGGETRGEPVSPGVSPLHSPFKDCDAPANKALPIIAKGNNFLTPHSHRPTELSDESSGSGTGSRRQGKYFFK